MCTTQGAGNFEQQSIEARNHLNRHRVRAPLFWLTLTLTCLLLHPGRLSTVATFTDPKSRAKAEKDAALSSLLRESSHCATVSRK